jgi:hypothetical protein
VYPDDEEEEGSDEEGDDRHASIGTVILLLPESLLHRWNPHSIRFLG